MNKKEQIKLIFKDYSAGVKNYLELPDTEWGDIADDIIKLFESDDYWEIRCGLVEDIEYESPCDPDITQGQIDAWKKYHAFIKERGQKT